MSTALTREKTMTRLFRSFVLVLVGSVLESPALAELPATQPVADVRGGLCLVIGATDTALAARLAGTSELYVQVLQPDAKLVAEWGRQLGSSQNADRERIGVRNAAFDPEHYGSNLFNLIVVEDAAAFGRAKLADIDRLLTPDGIVALRAAPPDFAEAAKNLRMRPVTVESFAAAWRKPVRAIEWRLPLEMKWQAGPRSQIANGFNGVCTGDGKLFYIEQLERNEGDLGNSAAVLFARDAYNGRTQWTWELPGRYGYHAGVGLVSTTQGRLFVKTGTSQVFCLDGQTGKVLFEVPAKVNKESRIWLVNDDLLSIHGEVVSTQTGKPLWKYPILRYQPLPGTIIGQSIYFCDGKSIFARKLADGADLWKIAASELPAAVSPGSLAAADNYLLARMAGTPEEAHIAMLDSATGKLLWTCKWKVRTTSNDKYFNASQVRFTTTGGKLLLYYRHNQATSYNDEVVATKLDLASGKPEFEDKVNKDAGDYHGCFPEIYLGDYIAYYDLWVNKRTLETFKPGVPHPACFFGMNSAYGLIFNFPSRKSGPISAVGPADTVFAPAPGGKQLATIGRVTATTPTTANDWPMFRGQPAGGNATSLRLGTKLVQSWQTQVGLAGRDFGIMSSQRTGLTQAVVAHGLAVVADIDGGRIVALDAANGKEKWVFHVGSRVDYPPALYNGLCLLAARDGWVYCLDAATGQLVYKLLAAPHERLIAGREKIESRWPLASDVLIVNGTAYVNVGSEGGLGFRPETGQVVDAPDAGRIALGLKPVSGGRDLQLSYDMLLKGNSIPRTNEDNAGGFRRARFGARLDARILAFDDVLTVAYQFLPAGEGWANKGRLLLKGVAEDPTKPAWTSDPIELVVDDMVLSPDCLYCVGHYQRVKKDPELWVLDRKDGRVLNTIALAGFPAFFGMSAADNRLFVATREGKLICYRRAP